MRMMFEYGPPNLGYMSSFYKHGVYISTHDQLDAYGSKNFILVYFYFSIKISYLSFKSNSYKLNLCYSVFVNPSYESRGWLEFEQEKFLDQVFPTFLQQLGPPGKKN